MRIGAPGWWLSRNDHIQVGDEDLFGIKAAHDPSDRTAPIASLRDW